MAKKAKKPPARKPPLSPCADCGAEKVSYYTDEFGMISTSWRCEDCHQQRLRRAIREDNRKAWGGLK